MTHLRQRMIERLQLRGLSERTQLCPFAFTEDIFFIDAFFSPAGYLNRTKFRR
jgi:hypothetical protein